MADSIRSVMLFGKTLVQALAETPAAALIARCDRADHAAKLITATLGDTGSSSDRASICTCQIRERVLLVFLPSAAHAAKLRQTLPRLLSVLNEHGLNLSEIRVRVQPGPSAEPHSGGAKETGPAAQRTVAPRLSAAAVLQFADKLTLTLKASPLREAARRLADGLRDRDKHPRRTNPAG